MNLSYIFRRFSNWTAKQSGSPWAFILSVILVAVWLLSGPFFGYSDTWQLVINTTTTVITYLMVFVIQNTQNRENKSLHLKMDELIKAIKSARNRMLQAENLSEEEMEKLAEEYRKMYLKEINRGKKISRTKRNKIRSIT